MIPRRHVSRVRKRDTARRFREGVDPQRRPTGFDCVVGSDHFGHLRFQLIQFVKLDGGEEPDEIGGDAVQVVKVLRKLWLFVGQGGVGVFQLRENNLSVSGKLPLERRPLLGGLLGALAHTGQEPTLEFRRECTAAIVEFLHLRKRFTGDTVGGK